MSIRFSEDMQNNQRYKFVISGTNIQYWGNYYAFFQSYKQVFFKT